MANGACRRHGGKSLKGIAAGRYQGKGHSKYQAQIPAALKAGIEATWTDDELSSLRDELDLQTRMIAENLKRQKELTAPPWDDVRQALRNLTAAEGEAAKDAALAKLAEIVEQGRQAAADLATLRAELQNLIQQKTRTAHAEWKRLIEMRAVLTTEQAVMFQNAWVESARRTITDENMRLALEKKPDAPARWLLAQWLERAIRLMPGGLRAIEEEKAMGVQEVVEGQAL
jgi:Spy/CpxP family protein refolding chaperone